jgi:hypothetical protein
MSTSMTIHADFSTRGVDPFGVTGPSKRTKVRQMLKLLKQFDGRTDVPKPTLKVGTAKATGTITLATCLAGTVIEINGVEFIAIASGTPVIANGEFVISGTDTADATSLVAAISGSTNAAISGVLTATSALGVVTLTAKVKGKVGNGITIKTKGVVASGSVTIAAVALSDTFSINGTAFTAVKHRASSTLTAASAIATNTCVINGVTFTAVAGAASYAAQQFSIDTSDTATAVDLVASIAACTDPRVRGMVTVSNIAGAVTVKAVAAGGSSAITLVGTVTTLAASAATLAGGAAVGNNEFDLGGTDTQVAAWLTTAINASSTALVSAHVRASSTAAVVSVYAKTTGPQGNAITTASSNGTRLAITGSAARLLGGTQAGVNGVQATATVTIADGGSGNYTVTVNGVATGNVAWDTDGATTATAVILALRALTSALVTEHVDFSISSNVITVKALKGGPCGNAITLSATGTGSTASAARLGSGAVPTSAVFSGDRLGSGAETDFTF